ncbi:MAG TPA: glycosyltransferase family 1 protein [Candidatus Angelobacter sp.]|nr:glycosyltransferase family 1 protein [Candidatus Angelobacter sp.]
MRILLVANYQPDRQRSMARYAELLHEELRKRGHDVGLIRPGPIATRLVGTGNPLFRWLAYLDKFVFFPPLLRLRARHADVVHVCDHSNSCYLRWTGKTPNVITAHDVLAIRSALGHFPQNPTRPSGVLLQRWILRGLAHARRIICVSEKTRLDLEALLPAPLRMEVVANAVDRAFTPADGEEVAVIRASLGLAAAEQYLLHVGNDNWYKNRPGVLRIMAELRKHPLFRNTRLVMAGPALPPALREAAQALDGAVVECAAASDEQLRALYTGALALLFPSLEEGFGWPILEAQACGCPVITSDRPPMTEVAGNAAIFINPEDAVGAAATLASRMGDLNTLREAGLVNVRAYSPENMVDRWCEIYRELASPCREDVPLAGK